jgi:hypothetical protein
MQMFIAELSNLIDKGEFEKSWYSDVSVKPYLKVEFGFIGRRISITLEPGPAGRWQTESVHQSICSAVRRVDPGCNIRWI